MRVSQVTVRKRLLYVLFIGIIIFSVICIRLGYVQFSLGGMLTERAEDSWSRNITFEPERGEILDRNGVALATNVSAPSLLIVPRQIEDPQKTAEKLAKSLHISVMNAYKYVTKKSSSVQIRPSGVKLTLAKAKEIRELNLKGVYIAEDSKRYYPYGDFLSHVLGFTGIDNQGLTGIELYYDQQLRGAEGAVEFYSTAKGQRMPDMADTYTAPVDGLNLELTIDSRVQTIMERELTIATEKYHPDGIAAIAMNPNTGEILGMASRPSFNPTNFRNVPAEVFNRNLPIWSTYEPGSTFKIITLAAALEEKKVDLLKDTFNDSGSVTVAGSRLRCWKRGGHGHETFLEVVQNSCNPGFVELGQRLGKTTLFQYIHDFGFGEKTGIDLQGEGKGIMFKPSQIGPVEQATTAFGQGVSVTPIQQVAAVAATINGGTLYTPYIAKEWIDPATGQVISRTAPKKKRQVISKETSKQVRYALESVVAQGTGKNAFVEGYRVGGKTGTAQKAKNGGYLQDNFIVSFIGFAPANDPQIVVYTAIDNPKGTIQFGGVVAAPIVGRIIGDSLKAMGVPPQKNQIEKETTWPDEKLVEVPDVLGMTKSELQEQMSTLKIDMAGSGKSVVRQSPQAGIKVKEGSTIRLYMN